MSAQFAINNHQKDQTSMFIYEYIQALDPTAVEFAIKYSRVWETRMITSEGTSKKSKVLLFYLII
jgi:hypothetical protein